MHTHLDVADRSSRATMSLDWEWECLGLSTPRNEDDDVNDGAVAVIVCFEAPLDPPPRRLSPAPPCAPVPRTINGFVSRLSPPRLRRRPLPPTQFILSLFQKKQPTQATVRWFTDSVRKKSSNGIGEYTPTKDELEWSSSGEDGGVARYTCCVVRTIRL